MAHALTGGELTILRENDQASELYLAIQTPTNVWSAEVQLPAAGWDNNEVWGVPYGTVLSGAGNEDSLLLLYGMTMYVSSSGSATGDYDVGMVRVRSHPLITGSYVSQWGITGSYVPIGETSNIEWGDGMVITVVDEFQLWQKQKRLVDSSGNTVHWYDDLPPADLYMDWDNVYAGQNDERDPIPILGSHAVVWIPAIGGSVNVLFDASDSYVVDDATANITYGWQAPGNIGYTDYGSSISLTYNAAGTYRVTCTLIDSNTGRTWAGHRYIFIYDANNLPAKDFTLEECSGNWDEGGWSFKVTMYDEATLAEIRDRSLCVLFSRDYYGTKEQYVGPITNRENVIAVGWVDGESIQWNPWKGAVEFEVQGAHWWLNKITSWPTWAQDNQYELFDEEGNQIEPFDWNLFSDMTIDKVLYQFLHFRSTITGVADVFLTGDDRQIPDVNVSENNLWDQLSNISEDTIQAHPCCDRYGRLYIEIDPQVVLLSDRGAIPTVISVTKEDWRNRITIERRTINEVSILEFSGIWYSDGDWDNECYEGGGSAFSQHGGRASLDRLLLYTTQADNLEWCGLALSWMNNEYPVVSIPLSANNRAIDICPHQYVDLVIDEDDTGRGIIWE